MPNRNCMGVKTVVKNAYPMDDAPASSRGGTLTIEIEVHRRHKTKT